MVTARKLAARKAQLEDQMAQQEKDTGHFRLHVVPATGKPAEMDFANGQTEVWLSPPPGEYSLRLEFLDNLAPGHPLADSVSSVVRVQ